MASFKDTALEQIKTDFETSCADDNTSSLSTMIAANTFATLELAEQQRIANLIALASLSIDGVENAWILREAAVYSLVENKSSDTALMRLTIRPEIAEALEIDKTKEAR